MSVTLLIIAAAILLLLVGIGKVPLSYNFRNLTIRWKTTVMTALAFTAVIALLTVMMAFVGGMRRLTEGTGRPGNVLVLSDGATDEIISNLTIGDLSEIENLPDVVRVEGRPVTSRETFLVANQPVPNAVDGRPKRRLLQLRGIEDPQMTARIHGLESAARRTAGFPRRGSSRPRAAKEAARGAADPGGARRGRRPRTGPRSKPRAAPRPKSPAARRRRYLYPPRSNLDRRGHAEVGRHDLQFRNLGQAFA